MFEACAMFIRKALRRVVVGRTLQAKNPKPRRVLDSLIVQLPGASAREHRKV